MPRKSAEAARLTAVTSLPLRPDPPETLSSDEAELWRAVVATKPVEWFQADSAPLLVEYCRAKVMCDRLSAVILAIDETDAKGIADLKSALDMRDKESRRLATLGCKLRLTQQSRYTPQSAATAAKPASAASVWQFGK